MPALEVLELDIQWNLFLFITVTLKSLVVVVAGKLRLSMPKLWNGLSPTLLYIQSDNDFLSTYKGDQQACFVEEQCAALAEKRPMYIRDEQGHWSARRPASFHPSNFQECCCSACPRCLARAGVPIMCDHAWTSNGFEKHLRPLCKE